VQDEAIRRPGWPGRSDGFKQQWIVDAVQQTAAGNPARTAAVLQRLRRTAAEELIPLIDDRSELLPPSDALLDRMINGLASTVPGALDVLTTLSAARDLTEGPSLLLPAQVPLATVAGLWAPSGDVDRPPPGALLRFLLLRRLAARGPADPRTAPADQLRTWAQAHTELRDRAEERDDVAGRLHHMLALRQASDVQNELKRLLPVLEGRAWLAILDQVVTVPDLSRTPEESDHPACLVTREQRLADPRTSRRDRVDLHLDLVRDYLDACRSARSDQQAFLDRAERARRRAVELA
jgi:hypothetical protein